MGLFSGLSKAAAFIRRQTESDRLIENMTGTNPKGYHPDIYKRLDQAAEYVEQKQIAKGGDKLNRAEFSIVRMALLAAIADKAEDHATAQKYINAVAKLKRTAGDELSSCVLIAVDYDICSDLNVKAQE